jgi:CheY-like chemotaxis protein
LDTGLSSNPELASALHRLRSTLARMRAELELAIEDGDVVPPAQMLDDVKDALGLLVAVEAVALGIVPVLVVDDDERLAELTARSLRRLGYEAESSGRWRPLRKGEVVVFDLGVSPSLDVHQRAALRSARPIIVTGAVDPGSKAIAEEFDASAYLVKPVEMEELAAAIKRRASA